MEACSQQNAFITSAVRSMEFGALKLWIQRGNGRDGKRNMILEGRREQRKSEWEVWFIDFRKRKKWNIAEAQLWCSLLSWHTENLKFIYHHHLTSQWIPVLYSISSTTSPLSIPLGMCKLCLICHIIWIQKILPFLHANVREKCFQHVHHCECVYSSVFTVCN